jgi:ABC-type multidrug transport system permease subunit
VQLLYFPMLFLSGATFPIEKGPVVLRIISRFIPATYLVGGIRKIILEGKGFPWIEAGALLLTVAVGVTVGVKLFRWEKEEKLRGAAKLWVLAVLLPFFVMGFWQWLYSSR